MHDSPDDRLIAVYGAAGHTGRFVVAELERRGFQAIAVGRDAAKLHAKYPGRDVRVADVGDQASLDAALSGVSAIINCAGPFVDTALPLIDAAIRAAVPYLDVAPEQSVVQSVFATRDDAARAAGVAVLPGAAFYGGLADLLASAALGREMVADEIAVAMGLDSWHPTAGTRLTGQRNTAARLVQLGGNLIAAESPPLTARWSFPQPIGESDVVGQPLSEVITLASHIKANTIRSWMNLAPLRDLRDGGTPPPEPADAQGRSAQRFVMDVTVRRGTELRRATASGRDIYHVSAPIVVEAVQRLLAGQTKERGGVHALGSIFDADAFLIALGADALEIRYAELTEPLLQKDENHVD